MYFTCAFRRSLARRDARLTTHAIDCLPLQGKHARSAVGTNALPLNVPVEIEVIVEVQE